VELNKGGRGRKCAFSTENWPYLGNGERYSQGYYLSLIESRILAFKWPANHRPWMTLKITNNPYGWLS